jgi:uncharacterized protein (DUF58 family)
VERTHASAPEHPEEPGETPRRPRTRITFEGTIFSWFAALFSLAALLLGENLVLLMGCTALCCGQAARLFAGRNLTGLGVDRRLPARGRVGTPLALTVALTGSERRPAVGIEVEDRCGRNARPTTVRAAFAGVAAGGRAEATTELTFTRRGRHVLRDLEIRSRYPLGLFLASARVPAGGEILVRPEEGRPTAALRAWLGGTSRAQVRPSFLVRGDDVFHGVREFRQGDDPRRIHWRTTARTGALAVMEWHREQGRDLVLLVGRGRGAGYRTLKSFERAVSAAATVWRTAQSAGLSVRLELGAARDTGRGLQRLGPGLDALATVQAQGGRRPRSALKRLGKRPGSRIVVYVASGPEPGIAKRLARAAGRGGSSLLLRADGPELARWVRGL